VLSYTLATPAAILKRATNAISNTLTIFTEPPFTHNATLSGKKLLAKILNEVKTANCFLSVLMPC
jgi:hypothetical protein